MCNVDPGYSGRPLSGILQSLIDRYGAMCPINVIGDFKVQLPTKDILHICWYKAGGFNKHSNII